MNKVIIHSSLFLLVALVLAGCGTYRTYQRPEEVTADGLYGADVAATDTASLASLHWSELFTDTCLQTLIRRALQQNTDLNVARLKVTVAETALLSSRLAYLPSAQLAPQGTLSSFDGSKTTKTYTLAAAAEWELDLFGRLTNAKRAARAALEQSRAYRQAVQTQLVATLAGSYYNLLMLDVQLRISRRTTESWRESLRTLELQKQFGTATEAAVQQARANLLTVEAGVLTLEQQISKQENALCLLLGDVPSHIRRGTLTAQQFPDILSVGVPLQLLARRPDIRQAEARLAQAFYATGAARSAFYPSVTLSGSAGWTNNAGAAVLDPGRWLLSAVGSLTQSLFNRGRQVAGLRIAKAQQQEALLAFRQSLLKAGGEVNDALAQWQTANQRLQFDARQIAALHRTVESTSRLMENSSTTTYLEVLTARQSLLAAELTEANDRFDKIQGIVNLYHALGGGAD